MAVLAMELHSELLSLARRRRPKLTVLTRQPTLEVRCYPTPRRTRSVLCSTVSRRRARTSRSTAAQRTLMSVSSQSESTRRSSDSEDPLTTSSPRLKTSTSLSSCSLTCSKRGTPNVWPATRCTRHRGATSWSERTTATSGRSSRTSDESRVTIRASTATPNPTDGASPTAVSSTSPVDMSYPSGGSSNPTTRCSTIRSSTSLSMSCRSCEFPRSCLPSLFGWLTTAPTVPLTSPGKLSLAGTTLEILARFPECSSIGATESSSTSRCWMPLRSSSKTGELKLRLLGGPCAPHRPPLLS